MYSRNNSPRPTDSGDINTKKSQRSPYGNVYQSGKHDNIPQKRTVYTQSQRQIGNYGSAKTVMNPPPDYSGTAIRYSGQEDIYTEDTVTRYPMQSESESEFDYESEVAFPNDETSKDKVRPSVLRSGIALPSPDPIIHSKRAALKNDSMANYDPKDREDEHKVEDMIKLLKNSEIDSEDLLLCAIIVMLLSSGCEEEIVMILAFLLFSQK